MKYTTTISSLSQLGISVALATLLTACGSSSSSSSPESSVDVNDMEQAIAAPELDPADQLPLEDTDQTDFGSLGSDADSAVAEDKGDLIPSVFPTETSLDLVYAQSSAALVESLNDSLALPADISVSFADCGTANAFYIPPEINTGENATPGGAIVMCHELTELFFNLFGDTDSAFKTSLFVLMHELGHALVNQLDVPFLGIEEAAVDSIGTVFLTKLGMADGAVLAGWFFFSQGETPFFDTHRAGPQRLGDLACWGVGGDPTLLEDPTISDIADMLVDAGRNCPAEYDRQLKAVDLLLGDNIRGGLIDVEVIVP